MRISWTAKKTNEWVFNKVGVRKELLTVKAIWSHHKETRELPGERDMPNARNDSCLLIHPN